MEIMSYDKYDDIEPIPTGYCNDCKQDCDIVFEDYGIGPYEYWGARGVHKDYRATCSVCGGIDVNY